MKNMKSTERSRRQKVTHSLEDNDMKSERFKHNLSALSSIMTGQLDETLTRKIGKMLSLMKVRSCRQTDWKDKRGKIHEEKVHANDSFFDCGTGPKVN